MKFPSVVNKNPAALTKHFACRVMSEKYNAFFTSGALVCKTGIAEPSENDRWRSTPLA